MNQVKNILIVEDEQLTRELLEILLSSRGYRVTQATDGYQGLELAAKGDFDAIITDLEMPRINGLEMIRILREERGYTKPIIIVSGYDDMAHRSPLAQLHLLKSLNIELLFSYLRQILGDSEKHSFFTD